MHPHPQEPSADKNNNRRRLRVKKHQQRKDRHLQRYGTNSILSYICILFRAMESLSAGCKFQKDYEPIHLKYKSLFYKDYGNQIFTKRIALEP